MGLQKADCAIFGTEWKSATRPLSQVSVFIWIRKHWNHVRSHLASTVSGKKNGPTNIWDVLQLEQFENNDEYW